MNDFKNKLEKYAELAVKVGVNIQQGQTLVVKASTDSVELVRLILKKAYAAGAQDVIVRWNDDLVDRTRFEMAPDEVFHSFSYWYAKDKKSMLQMVLRLCLLIPQVQIC